MTTMVFDIETLPAPPELEPLVREQYNRTADRPDSFEDFHRKTALSGNYGRILCIAYAIDDQPVEVIIGDEKEILRGFWRVAKDVDRFVGHNLMDFDFPFIMKRSIILGIQPSRHISFARYRSDPIYDTQKEWGNWSNTPSTGLDALAKIFGYPTSKQGIDGSQVYDFWLRGRLDEIYTYCQRDVAVNRQVYRRMLFTTQPPASLELFATVPEEPEVVTPQPAEALPDVAFSPVSSDKPRQPSLL